MTTIIPELTELDDKISAKRKALGDVMAEAKTDDGTLDLGRVKSIEGGKDEILDAIRAMNEELDDLGVKRDELMPLAKAAQALDAGFEPYEAGTPAGGPAAVKSVGDLFVESDAFKLKAGTVGPEARLDVDLKTLFETSAGMAPETTRTGRIVDFATRPLSIAELIPTVPTSQSAVVYMEETTFTNAAAETAEGGTYGEAALEYTEQSSPVRKIAVFLPVTDEQLEDEPAARARVNNRLPFMVQQRLDSQILIGDGTAPNLEGLLNRTGIQTQAKGADNVPDAFYKAMTKVRTVGFANPSLAVINPTDWEDVRLLKTTDGAYIWGNPADAGPERLFGVRVVPTTAITAGTGLVADTMYLELAVRRGIDVQISNSHADFFVNGKQAIRADMRAALQLYRPAAVATVTGLAA